VRWRLLQNIKKHVRCFAKQEFGWKDVRKEPPTDSMLVLLKDTQSLTSYVSAKFAQVVEGSVSLGRSGQG
jgi:hypothetical protein